MSNDLHLGAPDGVPLTEYVREFDHPVSDVFRAHTDPDIFRRWIGPRELTTRIESWDCRPGGAWRWIQSEGDQEYAFHGVFHTVRPAELILQTFEYEGYPDVVTLEYAWFHALPGDRCRLTGQSLYPSLAARERYLADGMESGITAGFAQLDELLAEA